ncbi:biotin synthase BioB [Algisphaera agarilytica]|uniref:Biotin synthase n=1 Tax=Algisphaera agarilytica TaxID=1385975 RepID=A0A7X0H4W1_9BACT|nr:biotin synthase BioB [Algisphaera agarilytica]MBB6429082.1 biotin synthase [Algisphaera agarilytica]
MDFAFYQQLADDALNDVEPSEELCLRLLTDESLQLMPLLNAAYAVRHAHFGNQVQVHILNNAQNGRCPEDCSYCTQAKTSDADIEPYPIKNEEEVLGEAERAYNAGAHRYCMVFSGRGPTAKRTDQLAGYIKAVKEKFPSLEVCVSAGLLDDEKAKVLKEAGLDRLNHNLNTSRDNYGKICTTHTYDDRLNTLLSAKRAGLETCSGLIAGMGETPEELIEVAKTLASVNAESIPVNFLLPFEGNVLPGTPEDAKQLTPEYCLRILCMFRLTNPRADVRCAAGREFHLRSLEAMCLYPANSLFLDGYLNGQGAERRRTYQMIQDAGFAIVSDQPLEDLLEEIPADADPNAKISELTRDGVQIKSMDQLRPAMPVKS